MTKRDALRHNIRKVSLMSDRIDLNRARTGVEIDAGLQAYMRRIFVYMGVGVGITGALAYLFGSWGVANPVAFISMMSGPLRWALLLSPFAIILVMNFGLNRLSVTALQTSFWAFCAIFGISMSSIAFVALQDPLYMTAVANAFFAASATFLGAALYGYTTNRDLTAMGGLLFMALFGLIIAMIANWFFQSPALSYGISILGVLIFTALTAYDTQRLKMSYYQVQGTELAEKIAITGALSLYLNFINLFLFLLQLFGRR